MSISESPASAFAALGVNPAFCQALAQMNITTPTAIQTRAIPELLAGKDVVGRAQTGTGKTAAYGLPLLQRVDMRDPRVQALVLSPTRELAVQVTNALQELVQGQQNPGILAIYGGDSMVRQFRALDAGVRVLAATPGRLLDHLSRGSVDLTGVRMIVLDEADEMLKMGFLEEVGKILSQTPPQRQTALFSATLPPEIRRIATEYQRDPVLIEVQSETRTVLTVEQRYAVCEPMQRAEAVARLLEVEPFESALVFARTRAGCDELTEALQLRGVPCEALHGDLVQNARELVLRRLREGRLRVVVATDVAARGLDVPSLDLVVTVELPGQLETYIHRIGRTGRAGRTGTSILVLGPRDERKLRGLERFIGQPLKFQAIPSPQEVEFARTERFVTEVRRRAVELNVTAWRHLVERCVTPDIDAQTIAAVLCQMAAPRALNPEAAVPPQTPQQVQTPPLRPVQKPRETVQKSAEHAVKQPMVPKGLPQPGEPMREPPRQMTAMSFGVGRRNGVTPAMLVACLAEKARLPSRLLGAILIEDNFSRVEVPSEIARTLPEVLRGVLVCGRYLNPREAGAPGTENRAPPRQPREAKNPPRETKNQPREAKKPTPSRTTPEPEHQPEAVAPPVEMPTREELPAPSHLESPPTIHLDAETPPKIREKPRKKKTDGLAALEKDKAVKKPKRPPAPQA